MVANQFPPMGGSGVQRSVKFVKHLRSFGYEPIVLTRNADNTILRDETLLKDVPEGVKIVRTKAYETAEVRGVLRIPAKVISKFMIPDSARLWAEFCKKEALALVEKENISLIYTTSAPYSDHLLGLYLKKKNPNLQWVVDFRDEWTNNPYTLDHPHGTYRTNLEKKMESEVLQMADQLIANTPVMRDNFLKNHNVSPEKFHVIPNGYDEEDFIGMAVDTRKRNDVFTMIYTGALYGRRKPDLFFLAIQQLKEDGIIKKGTLKVKLIGNYHVNKLQEQINSFGLADEFEIVGYVPHDTCIAYQLEADCLILLEGSGVGANAFYTGKVFEYMNTKRPVLAILPEGVAKDLVKESGIGLVADADCVPEIVDVVKTYYEQWQNGLIAYEPNEDVIARFERKKLTKRLAEIFDSLI